MECKRGWKSSWRREGNDNIVARLYTLEEPRPKSLGKTKLSVMAFPRAYRVAVVEAD
jgi:hypothetical protein